MLEVELEHDSVQLSREDWAGLRRSLESAEYSGRKIDGALAKLRFDKLRQLTRSSLFASAPFSDEDRWQFCSSTHPMAKYQVFEDWITEQLVPSPMTFTELNEALCRINVAISREKRQRHQAWAKGSGV